MKIPNYTPPNRLDHPGLPDSAYDAIDVISEQLNKITNALQKNISPEDNENAETRTAVFESGKEYDISLQEISGRPSEVRVLDHSVFEEVNLAWEVKDQTTVKVKLTWPDAASATATLLVRGASDGNS